MQVRVKKRETSVGHRPRRWSYRTERSAAGVETGRVETGGVDTAAVETGGVDTAAVETAAAQPRTARSHRATRRGGPPSEDRALYSCACGFVFDEQVSTSVACPHCGQTQAW